MPENEYDGLRDDLERCCCECGDYFIGSMEDDYCPPCWRGLNPDES